MNKSQSKYFNTAHLMDEALLYLLEKKDFEYITVKEICKKAGVNRSTFYLHYENLNDLLVEANEYLNTVFMDKYRENGIDGLNVETVSKDEAIWVTPKYLVPYLEFIRDNKRFLKAVMRNPKLFEASKTFEKMYKEFFKPVLDKFDIEENEKRLVFDFYSGGILAVVRRWIESDCKDEIERVVKVITDCVGHGENSGR